MTACGTMVPSSRDSLPPAFPRWLFSPYISHFFHRCNAARCRFSPAMALCTNFVFPRQSREFPGQSLVRSDVKRGCEVFRRLPRGWFSVDSRKSRPAFDNFDMSPLTRRRGPLHPPLYSTNVPYRWVPRGPGGWTLRIFQTNPSRIKVDLGLRCDKQPLWKDRAVYSVTERLLSACELLAY